MQSTENLNLSIYGTSEYASTRIVDALAANFGTDGSNMQKIDTFAGEVNEQIALLQSAIFVGTQEDYDAKNENGEIADGTLVIIS